MINETEQMLQKMLKNIIGVQFTKVIYPFKDNHYVHNVKRDKDGDISVIDQYGIDYKLFDVEFYVSDEHEDTLVYEKYVKYVGSI